MKKIILFFVMSSLTTHGFAQLKVTADGSTSIIASREAQQALIGTHNRIGIKGIRGGYGFEWGYGVYGESGNYYTDYSVGVAGIATNRSGNTYEYGRAYGVLGEANLAGPGYNYGLFGRLGGPGTVWGAAVYGTSKATDNGLQIDGRYAGYFNGQVRITDNLSVNGYINSNNLQCENLYVSSLNQETSAPMLLADDTESLSNKIAGLSAIAKYTPATSTCSAIEAEAPNSLQAQQTGRLHYGLSAEQMEDVFPELVYTTDNGTKVINYTELIPILIQSIAELKAEITALSSTSQPITNKRTAFTSTDINCEMNETLCLSQNKPNPFNASTSIAISIPQGIQQATLYIYDMNGKQIRKTDLQDRGQFNITLNASELEAGMYLYTLIANGEVVATKRMILTK